MKAELNNENKAKFFALYWGQDWLTCPVLGDRGHIYSNTMKDDQIKDRWLTLKPLSSISDEDAIEVAKMVFGDRFSSHLIIGQSYAHWLNKNPLYALDWKVVDYFRSKGYALPWLGLSVEEMVDAGWIKLIES